MAYNQVTPSSLTPSRPAPQAPSRQPSSASSYSSPSRSNTATSFASTTAYAPSINSTTTLNNNSPVIMPASSTSYATSYSGIGGSPAVGGFPGHMQRNSELGGGAGRAGSEGGMGQGQGMAQGGGGGASAAGIVRSGTVGFKEDAFANWLWREKYLILREQTLAVHKNEVSAFLPSFVFRLSFFSFRFVWAVRSGGGGGLARPTLGGLSLSSR